MKRLGEVFGQELWILWIYLRKSYFSQFLPYFSMIISNKTIEIIFEVRVRSVNKIVCSENKIMCSVTKFFSFNEQNCAFSEQNCVFNKKLYVQWTKLCVLWTKLCIQYAKLSVQYAKLYFQKVNFLQFQLCPPLPNQPSTSASKQTPQ